MQLPKALQQTAIQNHLSRFSRKSKRSATTQSMKDLPVFLIRETPSKLLTTIRERKPDKQLQINTETAAKVLQKYLIPMFDANFRQTGSQRNFYSGMKGRSVSTGNLRQRFNKDAKGTVYSEIKLSEELSNQLDSCKKKLIQNEYQTNTIYQQFKFQKEQNKRLKESNLNWEIKYQMLKQELQDSRKKFEDDQLLKWHHLQQITKYKQFNNQLRGQFNLLNEQIQEERAFNDKLKNEVVQLEHNNMLINAENLIIGEKLQGLYKVVKEIASGKHMIVQLQEEFQMVMLQVPQLAKEHIDVLNKYQKTKQDLEFLQEGYYNIQKLKNELTSQKNTILNQYRKKLEQQQKYISQLQSQRQQQKQAHSKLEKSLNETSIELSRVRQKLRAYQKMHNTEEKTCFKCKKTYFDTENYNWSCRQHPSTYSGQVWWCCGKTNPDAIGCSIDKHETKEEMGSDEPVYSKENLVCSVSFIQSCRGLGHSGADCPQDPNARNVQDLQQELLRVTNLKTKRKDQEFLTNKILKILKNRLSWQEFSAEIMTTEEQQENGFQDIETVKDKIQFDEELNLVQVEVEPSENLLQEIKTAKRYSILGNFGGFSDTIEV